MRSGGGGGEEERERVFGCPVMRSSSLPPLRQPQLLWRGQGGSARAVCGADALSLLPAGQVHRGHAVRPAAGHDFCLAVSHRHDDQRHCERERGEC